MRVSFATEEFPRNTQSQSASSRLHSPFEVQGLATKPILHPGGARRPKGTYHEIADMAGDGDNTGKAGMTLAIRL